VTVWVRDDGTVYTVVAAMAGEAVGRHIGISCDIGTTTVSVHLVDLATGSILSTKSDYNGQIRRGADIISRIEYAKTDKRLEEMRQLVAATINGLLISACEEVGASGDDVYNMAIAGNTTMVHLLVGLPPQFIEKVHTCRRSMPRHSLPAQTLGWQSILPPQ